MLRKLSWPQVAALTVFVAGGVTILVFVPSDKLPSWEIVLGFASMAVGGSASAFLAPLIRRESSTARIPRTDPPEESR